MRFYRNKLEILSIKSKYFNKVIYIIIVRDQSITDLKWEVGAIG